MSQAITWLVDEWSERERRDSNPHRPRRVYVEIEAISLRFSQSPGRV